MPESSREANFDMKKIEAQIQGLRDEVRDMMETLGKLSHEFSKVLMILANETDELDESLEETRWSKYSFS